MAVPHDNSIDARKAAKLLGPALATVDATNLERVINFSPSRSDFILPFEVLKTPFDA